MSDHLDRNTKNSVHSWVRHFKRHMGFRSKRTGDWNHARNIQDWLELDEGDPGFHLLTEEQITAAACIYLFSSALPTLFAIGTATGYGLDDRGVGVRVPVGPRIFSSPRVQTGSGAHPTSYPTGTGDSFYGGKAARGSSWPLTSS
jgi:hypothetical protein